MCLFRGVHVKHTNLFSFSYVQIYTGTGNNWKMGKFKPQLESFGGCFELFVELSLSLVKGVLNQTEWDQTLRPVSTIVKTVYSQLKKKKPKKCTDSSKRHGDFLCPISASHKTATGVAVLCEAFPVFPVLEK